MPKVDPYRFVSGVTKRMVKTWIEMEEPRPIPWTPLKKPLSECKVALLSSGGSALKTDQPFDQEGERQDPFWGDPTHRLIPGTATAEDIRVYHLHIDPRPAEKDLNTLLPVDRLRELADEDVIGASADWHYSMMGYILDPTELLVITTPKIIEHLKAKEVDVLILVPSWPICNWSVGLVQYQIEAAGITTIILANIPDFAISVSAPRVVGIEYPFGQQLGKPGDVAGQTTVLRAVLDALVEIEIPGEARYLPQKWPEDDEPEHAPELPPIATHLMKNPFQVPKLIKRRVP